VGLLALVATIARRPHFSVLYANLQQEDAAEVVKRLRDLKAPYRVGASGTIEAPSDRVDELRLDLASAGLPSGGQTGFELFDKTRIGLSEFGEQLNYQRALQGELARTISHLDSVEQARVHISMPRERLYESEQEKPTASVVLKLRGGMQLTSSQVASVVHLVSGAVGGLSPEAVTLIDTRGRLLSSADDSAPQGAGMTAASNQLQLRREYEREIEQAVQSMLDGVVGPGKTMVRASAALDFERVETERETYQPSPGDPGNGVLQSRRETKEAYHGLAEPGAMGIPGVSSNSAAPPVVGRTQPRADQYEHSDLTAEYKVSRQVERSLRPPGQLKRLSIAVLVDEKAKIGKMDELKAAVAAAAGLEPSRGDAVVISQAPFEPPAAEEKGSKAFAIRDFYYTVGRDFAAIVLMALFLVFAGRMMRRRPTATAQAIPTAAATSPVGNAAPLPEPAAASVPFDPDRAAAVLRDWLSSEPGGREETGAGRAASTV
jgi:flagellar M-ring protein FliF